MNETAAIGAYRNTLITTGDAKSVEAAAFANVNSELLKAMGRREADWPGYVAAISRNLKLWTMLSADIMSPGNRLPDETRHLIITLSKFVRARSIEIFKREMDVDAEPLIEINANIAAGLRRANI